MDEKELKKHLFVLILCGGGGTRLWPRSRNKMPKQFAKLLGKESLFQMTVKRFEDFIPWERFFIVTTSDTYGKIVQKQAPRIPRKNIIIEPLRRNTTLAHGLGALYIKKADPEAVILTESADHPIKDVKAYLKNYLVSAKTAAIGDVLVTTGIVPEYPHTGFGYVKAGKLFKKFNGVPVYKIDFYTEKPDLKTAKKFFKSGDYYWHANLFVWKASSILGAIKKHHLLSYQALEKIDKAIGTSQEKKVIKQAYQEAPEIAIEYAVAEKAKNFYVVEAKFDWEDVGNWEVIYELTEKNKNGNAVLKFGEEGEFISLDSKNNMVQFDDQLVALIGVEDLIVVDAEGIVMICPRNKAEDVKKMVKLLKKKGRQEYL